MKQDFLGEALSKQNRGLTSLTFMQLVPGADRCCFAEDGKEINQEFQRPCTAIVLLIKLFVWCRSRCYSRRF